MSLKSLSESERWKFVVEVIDRKQKEFIPLLRKLLIEDPNPIVRHECAFGLIELEDEQAIPYLSKALNDSSPLVRHEAAEALGSSGNKEAIPILEKFEEDENQDVRETIKLALKVLRTK